MEVKLNSRIKFIWKIIFVIFLILACMFLSGCKKSQKVYHVGILSGVDSMASIADGFKSKMTELGYVEEKDIIYDLKKVNADPEGEKRIVNQFVNDKVDLILTFPTDTALSVKEITKGTNIPVLFAHGDAVKNGLVESISKPGGNITGCRTDPSETTVKNVEFLHELSPQSKRIYIVYNPKFVNAEPTLTLLRPAISSSGLTLIEDTVNDFDGVQNALQKRDKAGDIGIDAILLMPDPLNYAPNGFNNILKFVKKHKIPVVGGSIDMAEQGSLFSNFPDNIKIGEAVANLANKILKGEKAGTIPVVTPEDYLVLNYKVAQELGLKVSEKMLARTGKVIR